MGASVGAIGETRERILDAGARMLRTRSYFGFSFNDIALEVGVRKASLHHHFGSKEALALELLGACLLYTSPSPRDRTRSRMPSSA